MKYLLSLGIVLFSVPLSASEIILEQVTLRRGMEGTPGSREPWTIRKPTAKTRCTVRKRRPQRKLASR